MKFSGSDMSCLRLEPGEENGLGVQFDGRVGAVALEEEGIENA